MEQNVTRTVYVNIIRITILTANVLCRNAIAGASLNLAMYPPIPSSLILGGSACIGLATSCIDKIPLRFIDGGAYVSIVSNVVFALH
jgi:hypothetical protein